METALSTTNNERQLAVIQEPQTGTSWTERVMQPVKFLLGALNDRLGSGFAAAIRYVVVACVSRSNVQNTTGMQTPAACYGI